MRTLILARGVPEGSDTLDGIFEFDQAIALRDIGLDVTYFGLDLRSIRHWRKFGISYGVKNGITWYKIAIPLGNIPLDLLCWIGSKGLSFLFKKVYKNRQKPDVIHAHFTIPACMAISLSEKTGIPLVMTEHLSTIMNTVLRRDLYRVASKAYNGANRVITVSQALSNKIKQDFSIDSIVIPNIIDVKLFGACQNICHSGFNVVIVAGLIERKRVSVLINAVAKLIPTISSIHLHIIGNGPLRNDLEELVGGLGIKEHITFYGALTREEISRVFSLCDCFALLSVAETFGVVYVEAMAAGLPVVATRCGGPEGIVNKENGLFVDIDNVEQAAKAIEQLYIHKTDYDRDAIKRYAKENFSPQRVASQIVSIYTTVLNNG